MPANNILTRVPRHFVKTLTFDGTTVGDVGTDTVATVTGRVLILHGAATCTTLLAGASATVELGTANNTAAIIAQSTATDIDANEFWKDTSPELEVSSALTDIVVNSDIILTVGTAAVTSGVLVFEFLWLPLSTNGNLA